ncbi:MAG: glutamate racemase [Bacteroidetes bacterium]|nr:glutamate racemase [Bacteroidota bacterium]MDA1118886.1 glutamate racemase [Bacteroidota bacterium]
MDSSAPIGIFDSGIGGMTVARAVKDILANEQIVYFGDTAHLPYGDKSAATIQAYSIKITDVLLKRGCKVILIACNSASSAAFELVKEYAGSKAKVFNVVDPMVDYVREQYSDTRIGLIGTKQTVSSGVYRDKIEATNKGLQLTSLATPLLVPMIEESFIHNQISEEIIKLYLQNEELKDIKALILACTHYPLIIDDINKFYQGKIEVIDSSIIVARSLKAYLEYNNLLSKKKSGEDQFLVSDYTDSFEQTTKLFFGQVVHLEKHTLWE